MPTLDWLNRDAAFRTAHAVPTRVLRPHAHCPDDHRFGDGSGNLLVQGDNLQALKALLPFYRGRVKCIFIDPPYDTKSAFEHHDDNLEHSQWLSMMLHLRTMPREIEKGQVGRLWPERSGGRARFAMLFRLERGMSVSQQIDAALAAS